MAKSKRAKEQILSSKRADPIESALRQSLLFF
jgi:hypothetical protein